MKKWHIFLKDVYEKIFYYTIECTREELLNKIIENYKYDEVDLADDYEDWIDIIYIAKDIEEYTLESHKNYKLVKKPQNKDIASQEE